MASFLEHHHGHDHDDDHDHSHDHGPEVEQQPAQQAMADALRVSFTVLKGAMLVLLVWYVCTGFYTIRTAEKVVVLRFGKITADSEKQDTGGGRFHFAAPFPFNQIIRVPTSTCDLDLTTEFAISKERAEAGAGLLNPELDGSLITGDANIIHAKWQVTYRIVDPVKFLSNISQPSSDPAVLLNSAKGIVRAAAEEGIVRAVAQMKSDDFIASHDAGGGEQNGPVVWGIQKVLDQLDSGIQITRVSTLERRVPEAIRPAYSMLNEAENERGKAIEDAQQERSRILGETAGEAHSLLWDMAQQYVLAGNDAQKTAALDRKMNWSLDHLRVPRWAALAGPMPGPVYEGLWDALIEADAARGDAAAPAGRRLIAMLEDAKVPVDQQGMVAIGGKTSEAINDAQTYYSSVVAQLQGEANRFTSAYEKFQKDPSLRRISISRLWQDAKEQILKGDVETFYLQPGQVWLDLGRDPAVRKKREVKEFQESQKAKK